jgi:hypothetical protein
MSASPNQKKTETDAVRTKLTAMYTLVNIRNDVAMGDHDSLEGEVSVYEINEMQLTDL